MIELSASAVRRAFASYVECYAAGEGSRAWSIEHQLGLYGSALKAFDPPGSQRDFDDLYGKLKAYWKLFRNARNYWSEEETFHQLIKASGSVRTLRLSEVVDRDWSEIWGCVDQMRDVKQNKSGVPSLVAISKFLHFWNPRLFMIYDMAAVEGRVFCHKWLSSHCPSKDRMACNCCCDLKANKRLLDYIQALAFSSELIRANPLIKSEFKATVEKHRGKATVPDDIESYEAAAVEWCLLGLAELPPKGVTAS